MQVEFAYTHAGQKLWCRAEVELNFDPHTFEDYSTGSVQIDAYDEQGNPVTPMLKEVWNDVEAAAIDAAMDRMRGNA
jgi:hypothetical protein